MPTLPPSNTNDGILAEVSQAGAPVRSLGGIITEAGAAGVLVDELPQDVKVTILEGVNDGR